MNNIESTFKNLMGDESGQDLIEYALLASFISLIAIVAVKAIGTQVNTMFTNIKTSLTGP